MVKKLRIEANIEASRNTFERIAREWHATSKPQWAAVHADDVIRSLERDVFPTIVYVCCFLTSAACAWLLGRSFARSGTRLLLWSSICFGFLALNNLAVVLDLVVFPTAIDLRLVRLALAFAAVVSRIITPAFTHALVFWTAVTLATIEPSPLNEV